MRPGTPWRPFASPMPDTGRVMPCSCSNGRPVDHDTWYVEDGPLTHSEERCVQCQRVRTRFTYDRTARSYR